MAVGYNPRIVTDKLVFCVDVTNTKSYPGSGTSLYDLSGNNYDGTMTDVTITSDGHMSFNGQNPGSAVAFPESNISKDPSLYLGDSSGKLTYECWINKQGTNHNAAEARVMSTDASDYTALTIVQSSDIIRFYVDGATNLTAPSSYAISNDTWYHIVATYDSSITTDAVKIYRNGELIASKNYTFSGTYGDGTSRTFAIASNTESAVTYNNGLNGYIDICRIYGKPLSVDEVKQNFNATRGRFGI
jgi:hypothetical protein|tara:strand:- start:89 stop:823 length:735 start_codon:yes stop_codon:yes gene_type:complete